MRKSNPKRKHFLVSYSYVNRDTKGFGQIHVMDKVFPSMKTTTIGLNKYGSKNVVISCITKISRKEAEIYFDRKFPNTI